MGEWRETGLESPGSCTALVRGGLSVCAWELPGPLGDSQTQRSTVTEVTWITLTWRNMMAATPWRSSVSWMCDWVRDLKAVESSGKMLYLGWALPALFVSICAKGVMAIPCYVSLHVEMGLKEGRNTLAKSHCYRLKKISNFFLVFCLQYFLHLVTNHRMHSLNHT